MSDFESLQEYSQPNSKADAVAAFDWLKYHEKSSYKSDKFATQY